jgi:hypothetical protein
MGMCACVLAIGPYSPDIVRYLGYPPDYYRATRPGATVVAHILPIHEGSSKSFELASCLGITDPWDFNQHKIDIDKVNVKGLAGLFPALEGMGKYADAFVALRDHGFQFIFLPNG